MIETSVNLVGDTLIVLFNLVLYHTFGMHFMISFLASCLLGIHGHYNLHPFSNTNPNGNPFILAHAMTCRGWNESVPKVLFQRRLSWKRCSNGAFLLFERSLATPFLSVLHAFQNFSQKDVGGLAFVFTEVF